MVDRSIMAAAPVWSESENERFERALATHDRDEPGRWDRVAAAVGGGKTADDVRRHYDQLDVDVRNIEAGGAQANSNSNRGGTAGSSGGRTNILVWPH
ncbi:hypothetical protein ACQ4PT_007782 [Festuca glaucescens]